MTINPETTAPIVHILVQNLWHDPASIIGNKAGLTALRDAIDARIAGGSGCARVFAADGEGYSIGVGMRADMSDVPSPYADEMANPPDQPTDVRHARKQALLGAADVLRGWIQTFGDHVPLPDLTPANVWATDGMQDCIDLIEKMAED